MEDIYSSTAEEKQNVEREECVDKSEKFEWHVARSKGCRVIQSRGLFSGAKLGEAVLRSTLSFVYFLEKSSLCRN